MRSRFACAVDSFYSSFVSCESAFCPSLCALHLSCLSPNAASPSFLSCLHLWHHPENKISTMKLALQCSGCEMVPLLVWLVPGSVADLFPES